MNLRIWRKAGSWGLLWGGVQVLIVLIADLAGVLQFEGQNYPRNVPVFNGVILLSVFGLGACIGLLVDDPEVTLRALFVSQLVAIFGGLGVIAGLSNLASPGFLVSFFFSIYAIILLFFLAMTGGIVGTFLVGVFEAQFPRSLDWRVLAIASVLGLVPSLWVVVPPVPVDSLQTRLTLWGGDIAILWMVLAAAAGSAVAFFGFMTGRAAPPRTFSTSMMLATLTGGVGLLGFQYVYSFYDGCFAENRLDNLVPPCPLAGDLLNLVVVVGAGMIPSAIVFLGCLFANDARPADTPQN